MAGEFAVHVRGLAELTRGLGRADASVRRELQRELRVVAAPVRAQAERNYEALYAQRSGDAEAGFAVSVRGSRAFIRNRARHRGYPYPARQEYEGRRPAFLGPAVEQQRPAVIRGFEDMIDRLSSEAGFGRGGRL